MLSSILKFRLANMPKPFKRLAVIFSLGTVLLVFVTIFFYSTISRDESVITRQRDSESYVNSGSGGDSLFTSVGGEFNSKSVSGARRRMMHSPDRARVIPFDADSLVIPDKGLTGVEEGRNHGPPGYMLALEKNQKSYVQNGTLFIHGQLLSRGDGKFSMRGIQAPLISSLVYEFSPETEKMVEQSFADELKENVYRAIGPAVAYVNGTIHVVQRIWLAHYDINFNKLQKDGVMNTFSENHAYYRQFSSAWTPDDSGRLLAIPAPTNCRYGYRSDGVMDPRLFVWRGDLWVSFHMWIHDKEDGDMRGRMFVWKMRTSQIFKLKVPNSFIPRLQHAEINWMPIVVNDDLYYIYSFDPMRVFKCNSQFRCDYFQSPKLENMAGFNDVGTDILRGGTPFVPYPWDSSDEYFISLGHSQGHLLTSKSVYAAHLIVLSTKPFFRIVYVSDAISIDQEVMASAPITREYTIETSFIFPVGVLLWSADILDFTAHLNDYKGLTLRLKGLQKLMTSILTADQAQEYDRRDSKVHRNLTINPGCYRCLHSTSVEAIARANPAILNIQVPNNIVLT